MKRNVICAHVTVVAKITNVNTNLSRGMQM